MPIAWPETSPPRPPILQVPQLKGDLAQLGDAVRVHLNYQQQLIVWLYDQLRIARADVNWLLDQIGVRNLIPDSDLKDPVLYWTVDPNWVVVDALGWGGGRGLLLVGGPITADVISSQVSVATNAKRHVLSGWIDASDMVSGEVKWLVQDAFGPTVFAEAAQIIGQSGRVEIPVTFTGTTAVIVILRATAVVTGAVGIVASQPQLEQQPEAGSSGVTDPAASLYHSNVGSS